MLLIILGKSNTLIFKRIAMRKIVTFFTFLSTLLTFPFTPQIALSQ